MTNEAAAATFAAEQGATIEYARAIVGKLDTWVPAAAGHETPTTYRDGRRLLYCFNPATGQHAYLNCETDLIENIEFFGNDLVTFYITGEPAGNGETLEEQDAAEAAADNDPDDYTWSADRAADNGYYGAADYDRN